jgi:hypothetical protein
LDRGASSAEGGGPSGLLLDCSRNGTFVNGVRARAHGRGTPLQPGDRVSLVLSVTPLIEHFFIFHAGAWRCLHPS